MAGIALAVCRAQWREAREENGGLACQPRRQAWCARSDSACSTWTIHRAGDRDEAGTGKGPTELQQIWLDGLAMQGWRTHACYGATEAIDVISRYMSYERMS